jgi:hypothetical protein
MSDDALSDHLVALSRAQDEIEHESALARAGQRKELR